MSYDRLVGEEARLREEIEGLTTAAARADEEEDRRLGKEVRGDELPAELRRREDRLAAIEAARERLEAAQRRADDERGPQPGQDRPAKGGRPETLQAGVWGAGSEGAEQLHGPGESDHEDEHGGVPAELQRADGGR